MPENWKSRNPPPKNCQHLGPLTRVDYPSGMVHWRCICGKFTKKRTDHYLQDDGMQVPVSSCICPRSAIYADPHCPIDLHRRFAKDNQAREDGARERL